MFMVYRIKLILFPQPQWLQARPPGQEFPVLQSFEEGIHHYWQFRLLWNCDPIGIAPRSCQHRPLHEPTTSLKTMRNTHSRRKYPAELKTAPIEQVNTWHIHTRATDRTAPYD